MTNGLLAPFWVPHHRRPQDYEFISKLDPPVVKIQDGGDIDYKWVREKLPGALVIARDWAIGEQHSDMLAAPEATGKRHAQFWKDNQARLGFVPAQTIVLGINEPKIWDAGVLPACAKYTVAFLDECKRLGLRGGALQLSVGWPNNSGPDTLPVWDGFVGVEAAIKRGDHVLVTHEYWADKGPAESWGWWAGRVLKCPWQVPIIIGECGLEMAVKTGQRQGWAGVCSAEAYADMLVDYNNRMAKDGRIRGLCIFLCDYANREWETLDLAPAYNAVIARKGKLAQPAPFIPVPSPTPPPVVVPPVVTPPAASSVMRWPLDVVRVTQWFGENPAAYARFGLRGHNGLDLSCVVGTPVLVAADGVVAWVDTDADYGNYVRVWHKALGVHSFYGHLSKQTVKAGDAVLKGQVLGLSGNTGNSTGPHLHFELRPCDAAGAYVSALPGYGKACDPVAFMAGIERGAALGGGSTVFVPFVTR